MLPAQIERRPRLASIHHISRMHPEAHSARQIDARKLAQPIEIGVVRIGIDDHIHPLEYVVVRIHLAEAPEQAVVHEVTPEGRCL